MKIVAGSGVGAIVTGCTKDGQKPTEGIPLRRLGRTDLQVTPVGYGAQRVDDAVAQADYLGIGAGSHGVADRCHRVGVVEEPRVRRKLGNIAADLDHRGDLAQSSG